MLTGLLTRCSLRKFLVSFASLLQKSLENLKSIFSDFLASATTKNIKRKIEVFLVENIVAGFFVVG